MGDEKRREEMKCPECNNKLPWHGTLLISRWTSIQCSHCNTLLNRKIDWQFFLLWPLTLPIALIAIILLGFRGVVAATLLFVLCIALLILDIVTVKLYKAEKRKDIKIILGHKISDDN